MKTLGTFTQDGFKASIELLRFQREQNNDLIHAITSLVGTAPTFIKGGEITQDGGNTTITNGIICHNEKLYTFTGGTFAGTPATLKVLFEQNTAAGYPQPYFVGDPIAKNIYLDRTARIDATGTLFLSAIGKLYTIQELTSTNKEWKNNIISKHANISTTNPIRYFNKNWQIVLELNFTTSNNIAVGDPIIQISSSFLGIEFYNIQFGNYPLVIRQSISSYSLGSVGFVDDNGSFTVVSRTGIPASRTILQQFTLYI